MPELDIGRKKSGIRFRKMSNFRLSAILLLNKTTEMRLTHEIAKNQRLTVTSAFFYPEMDLSRFS
jgi:hypothetical protein